MRLWAAPAFFAKPLEETFEGVTRHDTRDFEFFVLGNLRRLDFDGDDRAAHVIADIGEARRCRSRRKRRFGRHGIDESKSAAVCKDETKGRGTQQSGTEFLAPARDQRLRTLRKGPLGPDISHRLLHWQIERRGPSARITWESLAYIAISGVLNSFNMSATGFCSFWLPRLLD